VIPDTAVCLAFAGDATYPAEQTMVNGLISLMGHGMAGILAIPASKIAIDSPHGCVIFLICLTFCGALPTIWVTEDLRRTKFEQTEMKASLRASELIAGEGEEDELIPYDTN